VGILVLTAGCMSYRPGTISSRRGDEIVAAGQFIHTGTRVVLWLDPGGYDAYRVERRFSTLQNSDWNSSRAEVNTLVTPNRYGMRRGGLAPEEIERVRGGGWDLPSLQRIVDQFVIHYDACGTSRQCFNVLQDHRDLSVHFLLDLDGTIYQTLDLKESAWHASAANNRSIGIEIANIGAYRTNQGRILDEWYLRTTNSTTRITIPPRFGDGGIRVSGFAGHPARAEPVTGLIQDQALVQYDFTPEQYEALARLTAALVRTFPKINCAYPQDAGGNLATHKLTDAELKSYHGLLGHFHLQTDKVDPGPAFNWDYVVEHARRLLQGGMLEAADQTSKGHLR
jgi:N-acetylmuramoyl-L-alanine amidase